MQGSEEAKSYHTSSLIISEFVGCSPSMSGAIRVNPWSIDDVADGIYSAITMNKEGTYQILFLKSYLANRWNAEIFNLIMLRSRLFLHRQESTQTHRLDCFQLLPSNFYFIQSQ